MDASKQSTLSSSFKSKKNLHSSSALDLKMEKDSQPSSNPEQLTVRTPGKRLDPPRRLRNRGAALSIKEIRQAAARLRERGSDPPARPDPESAPQKDLGAKPNKSAAAEIKLPEKYELLDKFFNGLDCSIRLLKLKRSQTTFTNISSQIETLTDRRFTYNHLAQLKFIIPDAIELEKCLQHDERTGCMKPELRITMNVEAIQNKGKLLRSNSGNLQLRKVFRGRLLDFIKSHPEGCEIPEEELPELFNRRKDNATSNSAQPSVTSLKCETWNVALPGPSISGSHLPPSFKRSFSARGSGHQTEKSKQVRSVLSTQTLVISEDKLFGSPSGKESSEVAEDSNSKLYLRQDAKLSPTLLETPVKFISRKEASEVAEDSDSKLSLKEDTELSPTSLETPVKYTDFIKDKDQCSDRLASVLKTPLGMSSTPVKLMSATPTIQPHKRCYMSPEDDSFRLPSKLTRRPPPNRPLKFDTPVKSVNVDKYTDDDILSGSLLQSIQEKGRLAAMEKEPAISQARWRQQMIASLPKLFDRIHHFFHSIRRSVVSKAELVQTLSSQLDITDIGEVEEQLRLLQELAPEWIYQKSTLSGDLLCVNKISSAEAIRARLAESK